MTRLPRWPLCLALAALAGISHAAIPISGTVHYTQNFDTMFVPFSPGNVTASPPWADDSTIPGWWFYYAANGAGAGTFGGSAFTYTGADGTSTTSLTLNSMGAAGDPDRAFATPSTTARGEQSGIVVFHNTSGQVLELTRMNYNAEVRRSNSTAGLIESVFVWYRKAATQTAALTMTTGPVNTTVFPPLVATSPTSYYITGWTELAEARFTHSIATGNTPLNQTNPVARTLTTPLRVDPGEFLAVRFSNINDGGTDGLFGIDDLDMTFVAIGSGVDAIVSNVVRDDNGTPRNPADDRIDFTLDVTGTGPVGATWTIATPPAFATSGPYGVPRLFTGIPISEFPAPAHAASLSVRDTGNPGLFTTAIVAAPWCSITASAIGSVYQDGGTPTSGFDDSVEITVLADGLFTGVDYTVSDFFLLTQPYGVPLAIPNFGPGLPSEMTFTDSADPLCTTTLRLIPPAFIGINSTTGTPGPILSILDTTGDNMNGSTPGWVYDRFSLTLTMNNGGTSPRTVRSEIVDLIPVSGAVRFSMELAVQDFTTGFESEDIFNAELILTGPGGTTINLVPTAMMGGAPSDTDGDGTLSGFEIAPGSFFGVHSFSYLIPDNITSVQVVIRGVNNSFNELMTVQQMRLDPAGAALQAIPGLAVRDNRGTGDLTDDTFTVPVSITMSLPGASTGWTSDSIPAAGLYSTLTHVFGPYSVQVAPVTVTIRDSILGAAAEAIIILSAPPPPGVIGVNGTVTPPVDIFSETAAAEWVNDPFLKSLTLTNASSVERIVTSQPINLSAVLGAVQFTAELTASDTSTASNFEAVDNFLAELILDEGLPGQQIVNLITPYDTGVPNPPGTAGRLNGYSDGSSATDYNLNRAQDEFNPSGANAEDALLSTFTLSYVIPDHVVTAKLRIAGQCGSTNSTEMLVVQGVNFSTVAGQVTAPPQTYTRSSGLSLKIAIADILAACTAPPGAILNLTGTGPSAQGAAISLTATHVTYVPANDNTDTFTYTVNDGIEPPASNTITVLSSPQEGLVLDGGPLPGGGYTGNFAGVPGFTYSIMQSSDLSVWNLFETVTAPANGLFSFTDPVSRPRSYYRLIYLP